MIPSHWPQVCRTPWGTQGSTLRPGSRRDGRASVMLAQNAGRTGPGAPHPDRGEQGWQPRHAARPLGEEGLARSPEGEELGGPGLGLARPCPSHPRAWGPHPGGHPGSEAPQDGPPLLLLLRPGWRAGWGRTREVLSGLRAWPLLTASGPGPKPCCAFLLLRIEAFVGLLSMSSFARKGGVEAAHSLSSPCLGSEFHQECFKAPFCVSSPPLCVSRPPSSVSRTSLCVLRPP